jgi:lipoprotein NlpI
MWLLVAILGASSARGQTVDEYLEKARAAHAKGDTKVALELAGKAITADPKDGRGPLLRGILYETLGKHDEAVADFDLCLKLDPDCAEAYDRRGSEQFKRGRIAESLADFDRFLRLRPGMTAGHWKRGISLYYVGRYAEGCQQFKHYEDVDTNDVENAVWHFLCAAQADGIDKARKGMLKIGKDPRVPMMTVYDLFRGTAKPADVLAAAEAGDVPAAERKSRLFYAHLYLGLYYDMCGERKEALEHLDLAAGKYNLGQYMGDVARVHAELLRKGKKDK